MVTLRRLVGTIPAVLLLVAPAAACSLLVPDLSIDVNNRGRPPVLVTVEASGTGTNGSESVEVPSQTRVALSTPLGTSWDIKIDGRHVIGTGDRPDLALPSPGRRQDVLIAIRILSDGTVELLGACLRDDAVDGRCVAP